ncbi:hypothetical protein, partial [Streptomyces cyaneofuscatus]|uniref:hypothetical protein n=1 Tax=Streptomyces cyaneofuscatus TaxID=66883 RepID=UPI00380776BB
DPTGQSPEDAWNWFNNNILSWEGLPYLDIALAGLGVAATATGGGAPLGIALMAAAATLPAAADQIAVNATGKGFMPDTVRTAFDVAAFAGGIAGLGVSLKKAPEIAAKISSRITEVRNTIRALTETDPAHSLGSQFSAIKNASMTNANAARKAKGAAPVINGKNPFSLEPDVEEAVRQVRVYQNNPHAFTEEVATRTALVGEYDVITLNEYGRSGGGVFQNRVITSYAEKGVPFSQVPKVSLVRQSNDKWAAAEWKMGDFIMYSAL